MHDYTKYFKEQSGFDRFIKKIYQKYSSISRFSGTIKLNKITNEEAKVLSRLFGTSLTEGSDITLAINKFIKIMENSKFTDFDIAILIQEYLQIPLITNKEERQGKELQEALFYQEIISEKETLGNIWLKEVIQTKIAPYSLIHQRYLHNQRNLKKELINIIELLNHIPKKRVLLSIYASTYTTDPHYLDLDNSHSNLFLYGLSYISKEKYPTTREEKINLLKKCNIEIDSLSNFIITYQLQSSNPAINIFSQNKEPLILNIQNILNTNTFTSKHKKIFIFENPSILTEILSNNLDISIIITSGIPNTALYLLLDKLIETNNQLYYNGDFDPEGLLIADKLKEKYQEKLTLFCYQEKDYKNCISSKPLTDTRLKKLTKIKSKDLLEMSNLLLQHQKSAYQENNKNNIINYIQNLYPQNKERKE